MLPALLLPLWGALAGAGGVRAQDLEGWLSGLAGREGPIPREQVREWRQRQPDLPERLRRLAREGAPAVRVGAVRALGQVEEPDERETMALLGETGERAPGPALREAAWAALAARGAQATLGAVLGRVVVEQELWRARALRRLDLLGNGPGVHALTQVTLADRVPLAVRLEVVRRLGEVGATQAAGRLRGLRLERDGLGWAEGRRLECALSVALLRLGEGDPEGALPLLVDAALDPDPELAAEGLAGLRLLPPGQVAGGLLGVLRDKDPARRLRGLQLAGLLPGASPELVLRVEGVAADEDEQLPLRQAAVRALGQLGSLGSVPVLCAILDRRGRGEESPLRREAAEALGRLGPSDPARAALERALLDEEAGVRRAALRAVTALGDLRSGPALDELLRRRLPSSSLERLLRVQAALRLGLLGSEPAERLLGMRREDDDTRLALELVGYARALPELDPAVPALLDLLTHGAALVREAAHAALLQRTGQAIPYDPDLTPHDALNLERWRGWWQAARKR